MTEVHRLIEEVAGVDPDCGDREILVAALAAVARLRAWLDACDVASGRGAQVRQHGEDSAMFVG